MVSCPNIPPRMSFTSSRVPTTLPTTTCRYEGFRIDRHILTFQGHPEFTVDYERHLILNHAEDEDDAVKQRALETLETMDHQGKTVAEFLLDSFRTLWVCK